MKNTHSFPTFQAIAKNLRTLAVALFILGTVVSLGTSFYIRGKVIMEEELKEMLRTVASIATEQFHGEDIERIQSPQDMQTAIFQDTVKRLEVIRDSTPNIRYAYIMRRTENPYTLAFVADADSLASEEELDTNGNGVVDEEEEASYPGDLYDASEIPAMQDAAFQGPTTDEEFTFDQWGVLMSGYAPIRMSDGSAVAFLGIDMRAEDFLKRSERLFTPMIFLLVLLLGILSALYILTFVTKRRMEALTQIEAERSALVELASHQLRPLLALFQWWTDILREQACNKQCTETAVCAQLDEGVRQLEEVVSTLCEAQSLQLGKLRFEETSETLEHVVQGVLKELTGRIREKKLKMKLQFGNDMRPIVLDRKLIARVVHELLENAIDFSPDNATIRIRGEIRNNQSFVEIVDEGCGIPSWDIPRLFQKFARGSNATRFKPHGNGLGLFLAKSIVEQAGGSMQLTSKEGEGTTVSFTLPLH